jgi:acetylornithine deacetylase/succinyl-diaminopimelate desuccinylase-like protein
VNDERAVAGEVTELLQTLIRNKCVNDGTPESGDESRNASTLAGYLDGSGVDFETYAKLPNRASLVARLKGTDPSAPALLLLGHTDVVPVSEDNWTVDPFAGHFDGERIWGRGAIDMLNLTSSMAVALKHLAASSQRPRGDVVFAAVADEEAGGVYGAEFLVNEHADAVQADFVITESGGIPMATPFGPRVYATVGEKGVCVVRLKVRGVPGHASMPHGSDNAVVTAAKIVQRLADAKIAPQLRPAWHEFVAGMGFDDDFAAALIDPARFDDVVDELPHALAPRAHACARMTVSPTMVDGGVKSNVIPDSVEIVADVRTIVGQDDSHVRAFFVQTLAELADAVEIDVRSYGVATESPTDTSLWRVMSDVSEQLVGAKCLPMTTAGGTDAYFFRRQGIPAYGFGLFSERMTTESFFKMFHGDDEWVDQQSLALSTTLWMELARRL